MHPENGGEKSGKCTFFSSLEFRHNSISCLVFLLWLSNKKQLVAPFTSHFPPFPPFLSVQTKQALYPFLLSALLLHFNLNASPCPSLSPIKTDLDNLALSTQHFCGSKELLLRWNVAPFTAEKEWYCGDFCVAKRSSTPPLDKEERKKWKEKEYFLKKTKRVKNEKRQPCK